jgi:hypothetical protein
MAQINSEELSLEIKNKYQFKDNTFSATIKNQPEDRVEIEIGDSKQQDFKPQFKLMRWDNEVNFSIRAQEHPEAILKQEGDKIKYVTPNYEVHQYDKPDASSEGGFEFEWVLPSKPQSNVLVASIETKGLDFFYQPALTQKEIDEGAQRLENVVGSYAVYHSTKKNHILGQKNYKTGKAFHIFRPKAIDAKGKEVWCYLDISISRKELTVTIPQEFLDTAVYPIIVDPNFGYETAGGAVASSHDRISGSQFTGAAGTLDSISVYRPFTPAHTGYCNAAIYLHSDLSKVAQGTQISLATNYDNWDVFTISGSPSISAVDYVLAGWSTDASLGNDMRYDDGDGTTQGHYQSLTYNATFPDPLVPTHEDRKYSIYATYTASGSSNIKKLSGVAQASLKKVSEIAIASISKVAGVSN